MKTSEIDAAAQAARVDHRWSERQPLRIDVVMQYDALGLISGKTRDISHDGMFVETGIIRLFPNDSLILTFANPLKEDGSLVTVAATVRHAAKDGVGLQLDGFRFNPIRSAGQRPVISACN